MTLPPVDPTRERVLAAVTQTPAWTRKQWIARQLGWLMCVVLLLGALASRDGLQPIRDRSSAYLWVACLSIVCTVLLAAGAWWRSSFTALGPSPRLVAWVRWATLPLLTGGVLAANLAAPETLVGPATPVWIHLWCPLALVVSGIALGTLALALSRRTAPIDSQGDALAVGSFMGVLASLAVTLQCEFADPAHVLLTHVLPVAIVRVTLSVLASRRLIARAPEGALRPRG